MPTASDKSICISSGRPTAQPNTIPHLNLCTLLSFYQFGSTCTAQSLSRLTNFGNIFAKRGYKMWDGEERKMKIQRFEKSSSAWLKMNSRFISFLSLWSHLFMLIRLVLSYLNRLVLTNPSSNHQIWVNLASTFAKGG